ncbi:hypothetical protein CQ046_09545 [Chryseobacterium sp. MYb7]|uniref:DUF2071 domain-containing protein n=1 Tax=Chryseobacterium sp. MYb7 TaxID=1827290 RepID=UPI000D009C49|nr:DUF2071 domain-containing protein [Chryseobacterium sp. MYb7]PRB03608.1 hypothetical protein CQ046_09545 [Chryseobacterium sp. MYb7]
MEINNRIKNIPNTKTLTASTLLKHFSILTYLVDVQKLRNIIPQKFDIYTIKVDGKSFGLISAVTFIDHDFHFKKIFPFCKFQFPQTNYRAYIIDKDTKEKCAWFFGTGLGSPLVFIPRRIWKMPWFYSKYKTKFEYYNNYISYKIEISAFNNSANIDIMEDEKSNFITKDFDNFEEAILVLTHPVTGYFQRADNHIGKYKIWHTKMDIKTGKCKNAYFEKFEKLGLLNRTQMKQPYSVLLTKEIEFIIDLPPRKIE